MKETTHTETTHTGDQTMKETLTSNTRPINKDLAQQFVRFWYGLTYTKQGQKYLRCGWPRPRYGKVV